MNIKEHDMLTKNLFTRSTAGAVERVKILFLKVVYNRTKYRPHTKLNLQKVIV